MLLFTLPATAEVTVIKTQKILYPLTSRYKQEEGCAKIIIVVDENGIPTDVSVLESSGYARLDRCALHAIKQWEFLGVEEGTQIIQPVEFRIAE